MRPEDADLARRAVDPRTAMLLPEFYRHGLAHGDFDLVPRGLLGDGAALPASSVARLKSVWQAGYEAWRGRQLDDDEVVYVWADGNLGAWAALAHVFPEAGEPRCWWHNATSGGSTTPSSSRRWLEEMVRRGLIVEVKRFESGSCLYRVAQRGLTAT